MSSRPPFSTLDRYILQQTGGTFISVFAIVLSLMIVEHLPRLLAIVSHSGDKAFVVVQSVVALVPEYAAIGLLVGLYLSIALTIRRFSLRGELDIVQATGMSTSRWMRIPALLAIASAGMALWIQGWIMPVGEARLSELGRRLQDGQFGFDLEAGTFIELGKDTTLRFANVDPYSHELRGVFFRTTNRTFTATRGRLGFGLADDVLVDLVDGRVLDAGSGQSLAFSRFHFDNAQRNVKEVPQKEAGERRKRMTLPALLASRDHADNAAGWARLLWPAFALLVPFLAAVLGKPMRRSKAALGIMLGLVVLVTFIHSTALVAATASPSPWVLALLASGAWAALIWGFVVGERRWGAGYIDRWLLNALPRPKFPRRPGQHRQPARTGA